MSDDPSLILQGAINTALRADGPLGALLDDRIYDDVPPAPEYPFATFGPGQVIEVENLCSPVFEVFQDINIWSTKRGAVEVKQAAALMRAALDGLAIPTGTLVYFEHQNTRYFKETDPEISRALLSFRALIDL